MKTIGILLLFGVCTMLGLQAAKRLSARAKAIDALLASLESFLEQIQNGTPLRRAGGTSGALGTAIGCYLDGLEQGNASDEAARTAAQGVDGVQAAEQAALASFLDGMEDVERRTLLLRADTLCTALGHAKTEADADAKKGRLYRSIGVLAGAGLAILLL